MKLPVLHIGELTPKYPIIQGGMAVRISTWRLAAAVAAAGAIGVIGASGMKPDEVLEEVRKAKKAAGGGIVGLNIMFAARDFLGVVHAAIDGGIDFITSGAGFSRDLFKIGAEFRIPIVPIVSSAKLAMTALKCGASAIVVEGTEAGGHLGTDRSIWELIPEIRAAVKEVPVIAAGGLTDGCDIAKMLKLGVDGVQIATRFVLAEECNASLEFKKVYQNARKEDVVRITSPVGLPGRAVRTKFVKKILDKTVPKPEECDYCLKNCNYEYCIIKALINSQQGDVDNGIVFSGQNVWKIKDRTIKPAAEIIAELIKETEECNI